MARRVKPQQKHQAFRAVGDRRRAPIPRGELTVIKGGKRSYLWIGPERDDRGNIYTFSGPATLRALAYAILEQVGEAPRD